MKERKFICMTCGYSFRRLSATACPSCQNNHIEAAK
jgi:rubrerythrin